LVVSEEVNANVEETANAKTTLLARMTTNPILRMEVLSNWLTT
jgi:hypothetical protein